jgi:hypothetical protein
MTLSGAERQRRYRNRLNAGPGPKGRRDELLAVVCWCTDSVVGVPADEVKAGLTRSCGLPRCDEADRAARAER